MDIFKDGKMELKMAHDLIQHSMNLLELIPWAEDCWPDNASGVNIYPGVDEELQAAYECLDNALGVLQSPLAEIKELERVAARNIERLSAEVSGE